FHDFLPRTTIVAATGMVRVGFVLAMHGRHADFLCGGVAAWLKFSSRQTWQLNCEVISFSASASLGCRDSNCLLQYSQMPRAVDGVRSGIRRLRFGMQTVSHGAGSGASPVDLHFTLPAQPTSTK